MGFYSNFISLCNSVGKTPSRVVLDIGLKKSAVTRWKAGGLPTDATAEKIASYFEVPVSRLTREEAEVPALDDERPATDEIVKFALFGGGGEITDAMYAEVKDFAAFVMQREQKKKGSP